MEHIEQYPNFYPKQKDRLYALLSEQLQALTNEERHFMPNLANAAALLFYALPDTNWVGFYLMEGGSLLLGPFQGKTACIRILLGSGVCGTAAKEDKLLLVPDVHCFPGHIACDSASNSEIVLPIHQDGAVVGVLDIDSPEKNRFDKEDAVGLARLVAILEHACDFTHLYI